MKHDDRRLYAYLPALCQDLIQPSVADEQGLPSLHSSLDAPKEYAAESAPAGPDGTVAPDAFVPETEDIEV